MTDTPRGRNLVLIGCRGCGKTAVGRAAAARLAWAFVDTDERVQAVAGRSIAAIFATAGEAAFREIEPRVIAEVVRDSRQVLSVGGGAVLSAANRANLHQAGLCVWLTAPAEELHRRVLSDPRSAAERPALTDAGGLAEMWHLLAQREPLYAALADHVVSTAGVSIEQVAEIVHRLVVARDASPDGR